MAASLGSRLAEVLADLQLTQFAFAEKLNASPSFVSSVLRDQKIPGGEFLKAVHESFGVSVDWLLAGSGTKYGRSDIDTEFFLSLLVQTRLALLASIGKSAPAATLLKKVYPNIDLKSSSTDTSGDTASLLADLKKQNDAVTTAISILNSNLMNIPSDQRPLATEKAIQELIRSTRNPSIMDLLNRAVDSEVAGASQESNAPKKSHTRLHIGVIGEQRNAGRDYFEGKKKKPRK